MIRYDVSGMHNPQPVSRNRPPNVFISGPRIRLKNTRNFTWMTDICY